MRRAGKPALATSPAVSALLPRALRWGACLAAGFLLVWRPSPISNSLSEMDRNPRSPPSLTRRNPTGSTVVAPFSTASLSPTEGWQALAQVALDAPTAAERAEAAFALGELGSPLALQVLEHALYDPDSRVRRSAMDALSLNRDPVLFGVLTRSLSAEDRSIAVFSEELLAELREGPPLAAKTPLPSDGAAPE